MGLEMKLVTFILVTALVAQFSSSNPIFDAPENGGKIWALLIAGSNEYYNYRHQADVSHAYQILHSYGIPDENIVVMMYDDIANNEANPYPGTLVNKPNGKDVYGGVLKDYTGNDVNKANFLNILKGNKTAMKKIGSGKVIESGPNDHVFVNFVDHGAVGLLAIINEYLYADELNSALKYMNTNKKYKKLLLYIEACEAGSMFKTLLPKNIKILASTASNAEESSWGCYCNISPYDTCLGDLYSVVWMEHLDNLTSQKQNKETVLEQYKYVKKHVNESHVMLYGDKTHFKSAKMNSFVGRKTSTPALSSEPESQLNAVPSREAGIEFIRAKIESASTEAKKTELTKKLEQLEKMRVMVDQTVSEITNKALLGNNDARVSDIFNVHHPLTMEAMPCYKEMIQEFNERCLNSFKNPYVLRYFYILYNMCAVESVSKETIVAAFDSVCTDNHRSASDII